MKRRTKIIIRIISIAVLLGSFGILNVLPGDKRQETINKEIIRLTDINLKELYYDDLSSLDEANKKDGIKVILLDREYNMFYPEKGPRYLATDMKSMREGTKEIDGVQHYGLQYSFSKTNYPNNMIVLMEKDKIERRTLNVMKYDDFVEQNFSFIMFGFVVIIIIAGALLISL